MALLRKLSGPLTLETALIVASILLAFAIDAAWDDREERRREDQPPTAREEALQVNGEVPELPGEAGA